MPDFWPYLEQAPDAIVIVDQAGTVELINQQAETLFGHQSEDIVGQSIELLLPESFGEAHVALRSGYFAQPTLRPMASPSSAVRARRADGTEVPVDVALSPVTIDGRTTVMAVIRDVTKREDAELLLEILADLRLRVLEGKSRNELLDFVASSLMRLHRGTFAAVLLSGEDSLRMVSYATADGVVTPPASTIPLNTALADLFAADEARVFPGPGPGTPNRVRDWLSGTSEVLLAPVKVSESVDGLLVAGRPEGAPAFDDVDRDGIMAMALDTAISLALRRAERQERRMLVVEDRERIARDLHDVVIQRIFAVGMRLQSSLADPQNLQQRAAEAVDELDQTVAVVRESIFDVAGSDPFDRLTSVIEGHEVSQSLDLQVATSGDFSRLSGELVDNMVAVVDEALTNILRHASASEAEVHVGIGENIVTISVQDNGVGLGAGAPGGRGLVRLREQAAELGGSVAVSPAGLGGVEVHWSVPLESA